MMADVVAHMRADVITLCFVFPIMADVNAMLILG